MQLVSNFERCDIAQVQTEAVVEPNVAGEAEVHSWKYDFLFREL